MKKNKKKNRGPVACEDCAFYSDEHKRCIREGGKLFGVAPLSKSLVEATHDCEVFTEVTYRLAPKAILMIALGEINVNLSDEELNEVWNRFADLMEKQGYVKSNENEE